MEYKSYFDEVKTNLNETKMIALDEHDIMVSYEEVFKWKWVATKLKIFSFISYSEEINKKCIKDYSARCIRYARKNKRGLPVGFQNGLLCNNVLVSESVDDEAISFVTSRPQKRFAVFEMPIIIDLSKKCLYCFEGNIIWGMMYDSFIKNYIIEKLSING